MDNENLKINLLDYPGAAAFLGFSEFTLRRYVSEKRIPYIKYGPKFVRFDPADLVSWVESRRRAVGE